MFLVKLLFSRYKRKVLVTTLSAEMTKGYTDMLLIFQIFFDFQANFSYFAISLL